MYRNPLIDIDRFIIRNHDTVVLWTGKGVMGAYGVRRAAQWPMCRRSAIHFHPTVVSRHKNLNQPQPKNVERLASATS